MQPGEFVSTRTIELGPQENKAFGFPNSTAVIEMCESHAEIACFSKALKLRMVESHVLVLNRYIIDVLLLLCM